MDIFAAYCSSYHHSDRAKIFDIQVTVHRDKFLLKNQLDALISQIHFCNKTLQTTGET